MALGSGELSLLELSGAYATLARGGKLAEPFFISHVTQRGGWTVGRAGQSISLLGAAQPTLPGREGVRAVPEAVAYQVVDMMREVIRSGTGKKAYRRGYDRAGKTGTSSDYSDAWFMGMTPEYTVGVWIGADQRIPLGKGESGGKAALPAWVEVVELLEEKGLYFDVPASVMMVRRGGRRVALPR